MAVQTSSQRAPPPNPYMNGQRHANDLVHAAEVLASFNQYPIKQTSQAYANGSYQDPLAQDIKAHSRDLPATLMPILSTREGDPGTRYDINNCKGVNHIKGAMVPPPDEDDVSRMSPASQSSFSSGYGQAMNPTGPSAPVYQPTIMKQERPPPPPSPIKTESPAFQTSFQFVVNENAKEARNTVRKHVMKEFRRRERWEQGQKGPAPSGIEKKPPAPKKRRRRQDTPSDGDVTPSEPASNGTSAISQHTIDTTFSIATPVEVDVKPNPATLEPLQTQITPSNGALVKVPKKKTKIQPPVFAESKQHQLWGAVTSSFDEAIVELEDKSKAESGPYTADPWAAVAVGQVDPFTKLNMDIGPATQSLLHHFAWVMPSLMDSIVTGKTFRRIGWLYSAVAVHDPTPVHVILGYTLGHIASLRGLEEPPQALEHKSKAIKLLNHRMTDPEQCFSDGLIGAIVNFAGWELICANPKAYSMHMNGLGRIVTARGGMSAFEKSPDLETVIVRLDAIRAYVSQSTPRYPGFGSVRALEPVAINIPHRPNTSTWAPNSSTQSLYTPCAYRYCEDALSLMNKLEDVLLLCRSAATDLSGPVGEPFQKLLLKSLEQLLAKPSILDDEEEGRKSPDIYAAYAAPTSASASVSSEDKARLRKSFKALRLAALTLLDAAIKEFFDSPPYPGYYTEKLKHRFLGSKEMANNTDWGRSLEMLIAVLLQADRMALERPWRAWYAADALTLTMRISDWKWEEVGVILTEWVLDGGLEFAMPKIVEESVDTNGADSGSEFDMESRSKGVWDLRSVAKNFLQEWDDVRGSPEPLPLTTTASSLAAMTTAPMMGMSTTSGPTMSMMTTHMTPIDSGMLEGPGIPKAPQHQPPSIATTSRPPQSQNQPVTSITVNIGLGAGDGFGNGVNGRIPVSMGSGAGSNVHHHGHVGHTGAGRYGLGHGIAQVMSPW